MFLQINNNRLLKITWRMCHITIIIMKTSIDLKGSHILFTEGIKMITESSKTLIICDGLWLYYGFGPKIENPTFIFNINNHNICCFPFLHTSMGTQKNMEWHDFIDSYRITSGTERMGKKIKLCCHCHGSWIS